MLGLSPDSEATTPCATASNEAVINTDSLKAGLNKSCGTHSHEEKNR